MLENSVEIRSLITNLIYTITDSENKSKLITSTSSVLDGVGNVSTIYGVMKSIYRLYEKHKMEAFVIALYDTIHNPNYPNTICIEDLEIFFGNAGNIKFIAEIIEASLHSQSVQCSAILGSYAGGILSKKRQIGYNDRIVVSALKIMYDDDLHNFITLYNLMGRGHVFRIHELSDRIESLGIKSFEMELTIEKLKSVQAVGFDIGGYGSLGNAWGVGLFNDNSEYLYSIVKVIDLISDSSRN